MTEPHDAPQTAALLGGRYQVGDCIGQGGMARVYRAEDVLLGRTVAVKMMRTDADDLALAPRARTEMALLASLNHPSLVTLHDARIGPGEPEYLVMEFVNGPSLSQALHEGPMTAAEVSAMAVELASALHVVHRAGIIHRDIKPSNVLLAPSASPGRRYWAKLADFGVAYLADSTRHTAPGTVIGTAAYLAPEQVRGEPAGPPADIYALGLLLLEAVTGDRAFPEASGIGQVTARLIQTPEVPDWIGPEWSGLLREMISIDPADRPAACDVAERAAALPTDLVRPARAAAATSLGQPTLALPVTPSSAGNRSATKIAIPPVPPLPPTRAARHPSSRARRGVWTRPWALAGYAAVAAVVLVIVGNVWAGGVPGPATPEVGTTATVPTPAVEEVADESDEIEPLPSDDTATEPVTRTVDAPTAPKPKADPGASKAAKEAAKAAEKAAKEKDRKTGPGSGGSGNGNGNGKGGPRG
ncbi:serine/threonine-protein kinase [Microbacterium sp.]|uniref:serine/threonine-protein kinase n=1 Tax=Microbacterium sp. TaxID=51671 RepID=UPI0037350965